MKPWRPSNGTEGVIFQEQWCAQCQRDNVMNGAVDSATCAETDYCSILNRSFQAGPLPEWREDELGMPFCTEFLVIEEAK
jgi:hypothetical protein